ncbi:MAG TPA: hypothetical protein VN622_11180 [Clostridia bacterium]|nr:hypothetical protein [Clostridia bacterium]
MKRNYLFRVGALALASMAAVAQEAGPKSTNNWNEPATKIQSQKTGQAGASTTQASQAGAQPETKPVAQSGNQPQTSDGPQTVILPATDAPVSADPLIEAAESPKGPLTLIGGTAVKVDRVRNRLVLQPFGGGKKMRIVFDDRSHIYRDGRETTVTGIREGDRVYVDTMLVGGSIFARNLRVQTQSGPAEARGQITAYNPTTGIVTMQDQLTAQSVEFVANPGMPVKASHGPATVADLRPGALVDVIFQPGRGRAGGAREISILALPGASYFFAGRVTNVDLSAGLLAIENQSDNRNYELRFDPARLGRQEILAIGAEITANATFDGRGYMAQTLSVSQPAAQQ